MRVSMDVTSEELFAAINWFRELCGSEIAGRLQQFELEAAENPLLKQYNWETFKLEYAIGWIFLVFTEEGVLPQAPQLAEAYNFVAGFCRVHANLTRKGKKRLVKDLRGCFSQCYGLRPFAFEFLQAIHFLRLGWDVTFVDVEKLGRFDLLVQNGDERFEIECKSVSNDAGRLISRKDVCRVGGRLHPIVNAVENRSPRLLIVRVIQRLDALTEADLQALTDAARNALESGISTISTAFSLTLELRPDLIVPPDMRTNDGTTQFIRERIGTLGRHIMINANRRTGETIAIALESEEPDDVLGKIYERVEKAASQFSGNLPSLVSIQIADMPRTSLQELLETPGSGVHRIAHRLFAGPEPQPHVNAIAFSALPIGEEVEMPSPEISTMSANVLVLRNPNSQHLSVAIRDGNFFA